MNKRKRLISILISVSYLLNQSINVFAEEQKNIEISNLKEMVKDKEISDVNGKNSRLAEVYLDGSIESSGSGADADNPVNSFNEALDLVTYGGVIYVSGEVSITDDIHIPEKLIYIKQQSGKDKGKLKFEKNVFKQYVIHTRYRNGIFVK